MEEAIKNHFIANLPKKPYTTSNLDYGLKIRTIEAAIKNIYLQHNPPAQVVWLVFDCDKSNSYEVACQQAYTPPPNLEVFNKANGHSHLFYGLQAPVTTTEAARIKPIKYLAAIEYSLSQLLDADQSYAGLISKNPLHEHWHTIQRRDELWSLSELADWLDLPSKLPRKATVYGLGRNCSIFDTVRKWAYKEVLKYRLASNNTTFLQAVKQACSKVNSSFPTPLPEAEISAIAKSIAAWVWDKYTARLREEDWKKYVQDTHTPEIQAIRGKRGGLKSGVVRNQKIQESIELAQELYEASVSPEEICEMLEISKRTFWYWMRLQK